MIEKTDIITFTKFNDYYAAANTPLRSMHDEFHVFRFSDLGDEIVPQMGPFSIAYFQFAIGSEVQAKVGVFDTKIVTEKHTMVIYLPGQILHWEKTGNWDGYVLNVKDSFLSLGSIAHLTESFGFLHSLQPLVISISKKDYKLFSKFYELMLNEQKQLHEENLLIIRNLMQVLIIYINRIVSEEKTDGTYVELPHQKIATRFKSLVIQHYQHHKSVAFYAGLMGISSTYLGEAVKRVFKTTPKGIINEITFFYAKTLLSSSDIGIKELAWTLNFDDYSHFVKFFKKMSGITPAAFRNALKNQS